MRRSPGPKEGLGRAGSIRHGFRRGIIPCGKMHHLYNQQAFFVSSSRGAVQGYRPYLRSFCRSVARWIPSCWAATARLPWFFRSTAREQRRLDECQQPVVEARAGVLPATAPARRVHPPPSGVICRGALVDSRRGLLRSRSRAGKMLGPDVAAAGDDRRVLDGVAQLADVARPGPRHQLADHVVAQRDRARRPASRDCRRKCSARAGMSSRRSRSGGRWIGKTLRRKNRSSRNWPGGHQLVERPVGRGQDADVDRPGPGIARPASPRDARSPAAA